MLTADLDGGYMGAYRSFIFLIKVFLILTQMRSGVDTMSGKRSPVFTDIAAVLCLAATEMFSSPSASRWGRVTETGQ